MRAGWRALTDRGRALAAAGLTLAASGVALGFVDLTRVGVLALSLPFLAAWTLRLTRPRLQVQRQSLPGDPHLGSTAEVSLNLDNTSRSILLASAGEDHLDPTLGPRTHLFVPRLRPGGHTRLRYTIRPTRRGLHRVGPLRLRHRDPFGLASMPVTVPGSLDLLVLPVIHPLPTIRAGAAGAGSQGSGNQSIGSTGIDDAILRGYQMGDDLRHVHWPVSAHRGQLMVRHEGRPTLRRVTLAIDPDLAGPPGQRRENALSGGAPPPSAALDWGVEALSSIATHLAATDYVLHVATPPHPGSAGAREADGRHGGYREDIAADRLDLERAIRELAVIEPGVPSTSTKGSHIGTPHGALESPLVTRLRDLAAGGGLLVVVVGDANPSMARHLFDARPTTATGLAFVLSTGTFDGGSTQSSAARNLAGLASAGGWRVTVVDAATAVDAAWAALTSGSAGQP